MTKKEFEKAFKKENGKDPESKKIKKRKKYDASVIWPSKERPVKLINAQHLLKTQKRLKKG